MSEMPESAQIVHEHTGCEEDEQQAGDEAVDTGRLRQCNAQDQGAGDVALAFGLAANGLTSRSGGVAFAECRGRYQRSGQDLRRCRSQPERYHEPEVESQS